MDTFRHNKVIVWGGKRKTDTDMAANQLGPRKQLVFYQARTLGFTMSVQESTLNLFFEKPQICLKRFYNHKLEKNILFC